MNNLRGEHIELRALEPHDLEALYKLENDPSVWEISNTTTPYSKYVLKQYLENAHRDIYEVKQLRLVVTLYGEDKTIGFIDFFDFDPKHARVGVGIIIFSEEDRRKGHAIEALELLCNYAFSTLNMHQLFANISEDNTASISLFEKAGFTQSGVKKDWIRSQGTYKNELFYQKLNHED